jgi:hypothetical protein
VTKKRTLEIGKTFIGKLIKDGKNLVLEIRKGKEE